MKITEMDLPPSLFTEITNPDGTRAMLVVPDKLISWAEDGDGDAIARLCHSAYERAMARIQAWEQGRIRQLGEELRETGNGEILRTRRYHNVKRYHTTREDIIREAEMKQAGARKHMVERQTAIEKLVQEAREFILLHQVRHEHDDVLPYLLLIATLVLAVYSLYT